MNGELRSRVQLFSSRINSYITLSAMFGALAGFALALLPTTVQADTNWTGATSQDWFTASNWDNGLPGTGNNDAIVSIATGNYPILTADATSSRDVRVGTGANGRLDQRAGTLNTGDGSWFWHGYLAANATYNLANTAATGGTYTGFGQGTGSINIGGTTKNGNMLVGLDNGTVSTVNVNTTGTLAAGGIFLGAAGGSNGHFNIDNGTVTLTGEFQVGASFFSQGSGTDNTYQQSGGTVTADIFSLARGSNNAATMKGTATITGGTLNTLHWFTLGFAGSATDTATVTNSGGTINVNTAAGGAGVLEMGVFDATQNVFNQNSGTLTLQNNASISFGNGGNHTGTATFNQTGGNITFYSDSGTTAGGSGSVNLGNGGSTGTYVYNFNGGTLTTPGIQKTAASASGTFNFNGGTLKAATNNTSFLQNLTAANVRNSGAIIDTNGFNVTAATPLQHSAISGDNATDGGLTKNGAGILTLAGSSTYTGNTTVNGGTLLFSGVGPMTSNIKNISVANGAGVGAGVGALGTTRLTTTGLALGTAGGSTSLLFDFNNLANPTVPILADTGAFTIGSSTVAVSAMNAAGLTSGTVTLLDYTGSALSASDFAKFNSTVALAGRTQGTLINNTANTSIDMAIVAAPVMWRGDVSGNWDKAEGPGDTGGTLNFRVNNGATATAYRQASVPGDVVLFADTYNGVNAPTTTNITITEAVSPAAVTVNNSAVNYTFGGTVGIGGSTAVTKSGTASLAINNLNTYTGGTNFNGGTLSLGDASALGNGPLTIGAGSAKTLSTSAPLGALTTVTAQSWNDDFTFTGGNDLDMGTAAVTLGGTGTSRTVNVSSGTLSVGEVRGTAHGLVKQGAGTLLLTSTGASGGGNGSIIAGPLNVAGGTVQINRSGATGGDPSTGDLTVGGLSGSGSVVNGAGEERWLFVNPASGTFDFTGTLNNGNTGILGFVKQGAGTQKLSGANTFSGPSRLTEGTLILANASALGNTSKLYLGEGANTLSRTLSFATDSDSIVPALVFGWGNTATIVSDRATPGAGIDHLVTTDTPGFGDGVLTFTSGPNVTSGTGSISFIQVNLGAGAAGEVTTFNPTSANVRIGGISKAYVDMSATVNFGGTTTGNEVIDVISNGIATGTNNVSIIKSNTSTWTLSGANSYTGNTSVLGGTLSITNAYLADTADVFLATGGNFNLNFAGNDVVDSLYINNIPQAIGTWGGIGSGAAHQTALITGSGILDVTTLGQTLGVPGDYNNNGVVDAADYVVWRKHNGTAFQLPNEVAGTTPGQVSQEDFAAWRARFGNTSGSGSSLFGAGSAVPEPGTFALVWVATASLLMWPRKRAATANASV